MQHIRVTPAKNLRVADPELHDFIPAEGRMVVRNVYWLRRLRDGDVVFSEVETGEKPDHGQVEKADAQDAIDVVVIKSKKLPIGGANGQ